MNMLLKHVIKSKLASSSNISAKLNKLMPRNKCKWPPSEPIKSSKDILGSSTVFVYVKVS